MNLRQILLILRLRWWIVLGTLLTSLALALAISLLLPKQYTAETSLLLDVKTDPLVATLAPNFATPSYIATQTEIIQSERVAGRVVKMLGLAQNAKAVEQWREETEGRVPLETYFGSLLQKGLKVEPGRGSSLLTISFTGSDPKFAAAGANTFARAYLDTSVELRVDPAREYAKFFDDRIKQLRTDLESAQERLSAFQQRRGIVVTNERMDQEVQRLTSLETALSTALAEQADTSSRISGSGGESSADVQSSAAVQSLKAELARAQTQLTEVSARFGSNHPQRRELEARVSELRQQLSQEMRRVGGGTASVNRIASQKVAELRNMVEGQKRAVLQLRSQRDEASVLLRDVDTAQRAYDAVAQRRTQLANEAQAEQTPARVLSPAIEPLRPSKPNLVKNALVGVILGLLGGVGLAFLLEYIDRRVRSADDLMTYGDVPVLGVMSNGPGRQRFAPRLAQNRRPALPAPQLTFDGGAP
jgi:chain length determinant protein EpsF